MRLDADRMMHMGPRPAPALPRVKPPPPHLQPHVASPETLDEGVAQLLCVCVGGGEVCVGRGGGGGGNGNAGQAACREQQCGRVHHPLGPPPQPTPNRPTHPPAQLAHIPFIPPLPPAPTPPGHLRVVQQHPAAARLHERRVLQRGAAVGQAAVAPRLLLRRRRQAVRQTEGARRGHGLREQQRLPLLLHSHPQRPRDRTQVRRVGGRQQHLAQHLSVGASEEAGGGEGVFAAAAGSFGWCSVAGRRQASGGAGGKSC